jgi:hypothetical protein
MNVFIILFSGGECGRSERFVHGRKDFCSLLFIFIGNINSQLSRFKIPSIIFRMLVFKIIF